MKASELIGELVKAIAASGDREVMLSIYDGPVNPIAAVVNRHQAIYLRDPDGDTQ